MSEQITGWYTLAHLITSERKAEAQSLLGVLVQTCSDTAHALLLEGDLLLACADTPGAIAKYYHAAQQYTNDGRLSCAGAVYEHLLMLDAQATKALSALFIVYAQEGTQEQLRMVLARILEHVAQRIMRFDQVQQLFTKVQIFLQARDMSACYAELLHIASEHMPIR